MEFRRPSQSPSVSPWLDGFLNGCVQGTFDCGWPKVTGGLLIHAVPQDDQSQSLLIDATPDSNKSTLCPPFTTGIFYNNAFCDWYDAAVQPGVANSFVPNGHFVAPYYVTVLSAGATGAMVAVNSCPCQDRFSPSAGNFGEVSPGGAKSITFTVSNTAVGVTHTISNPMISGSGASAFSITASNCGNLAPGASCQIAVSFHPSVAGSFSATLNVSDTNPVWPDESINLTGSTPAIVIGHTGFSPNEGCLQGFDWVQGMTAPTSPSYVVPAGATEVTQWSTFASYFPSTAELEIWRPTSSAGTYVLVGLSPIEAIQPNVLNTFQLASPIPVQAGDVLGIGFPSPGKVFRVCKAHRTPLTQPSTIMKP